MHFFQATLGEKFAPLIGLRDDDMNNNTMITIYNTAVTDAASEILGKEPLVLTNHYVLMKTTT